MTPHVIRLRGPWDYAPLKCWQLQAGEVVELSDVPPAGRVQMPCDWSESLGADYRGVVRFSRKFNRPTNLTSMVYLVFAAIDGAARVELNGELLGQTERDAIDLRFDVTHLIQLHNRLLVEVALRPLPPADEAAVRGPRADLGGGLIGEVRLEIW